MGEADAAPYGVRGPVPSNEYLPLCPILDFIQSKPLDESRFMKNGWPMLIDVKLPPTPSSSVFTC